MPERLEPASRALAAVALTVSLAQRARGAGARGAALGRGAAHVLRADRQARGAGGGQCLRRQDRREPQSAVRRSVLPPLLRRQFGRPREQVQRSLGSGVIVDPSGLVVTNNHVIEGADQVKVSLADKREFEAEIVLKDPRSDLAVLRLKDAQRALPGDRVRQFRRAPGRRRGAGDRQSVRRRPDRDPRHRLGGGAHPGRHHRLSVLHPDRRRDQSRQFRRRAGRHDRHGWSASTPRSSRAPAARRASASPFPPTWCAWWSPRPRPAAARCKRPWLGAKLQAVTPEIAEELRPQAAGRRAGRQRHRRAARRRGPGCKHRRSDRLGRRPAGRRSQRLRLSLRHQAARRPGAARRACAAARRCKVAVALETAPEAPRDEIVIKSRSPFLGAKVANLSPALADELRLDAVDRRRRRGRRRRRHRWRRTSASRSGDVVSPSTTRRSPRPRDLERVARRPAAGSGASPSSAAASRSRPCSADEPARQTRRGPEPVRGRGPRPRCAAAARRQAAAAEACRRGRPGPSARARRRADAHARRRARSAR